VERGRRRWKGWWSRNHFCRPEKLFFTLFARFISPNRFSTDSSETVHIFVFSLPTILRRYINTIAAFYFSSRLIHATGLSQRKFYRGFYRDIFYSEDWKVTDIDSL